jgi:hypothetical protein
MHIVMTVDGKEIVRTPLLPAAKVTKELEELKRKYHKEIESAGGQPKFYIDNVPSVINNFKSLLADGDGEQGNGLVHPPTL